MRALGAPDAVEWRKVRSGAVRQRITCNPFVLYRTAQCFRGERQGRGDGPVCRLRRVELTDDGNASAWLQGHGEW
jgi:hypothetical protein